MAFHDDKYLLRGSVAVQLYSSVKNLPIIDAHNHADVKRIADDTLFSDPWELFAATDHYVWEVMRKRGVSEEYITGTASNRDKFLALGKIFPELAGNPIYDWIHLDLAFLGFEGVIFDEFSSEMLWDALCKTLSEESSRPRALIKEMNIETMCSTDDPADDLADHVRANAAFDRMLIRPTWRPDKYMFIDKASFRPSCERLGKRYGIEINSLENLLCALRLSHDFFAANGCTASDHGLEKPFEGSNDIEKASAIFDKVIKGESVTSSEADDFASFMLFKFAELDSEKDFVFQLHIGAVRDVRASLYNTLGPDSGGDLADHSIDIVKPLCRFLNHFDNSLKTVLYCLEPSHQSDLAGVSRAFGSKVNLGSAWWLNDTPIGMKRQLEYISSIDLFYNFAGMVSDSRKLLSYGSRFSMFRRILCSVIGEMVEDDRMPYSVAEKMLAHMCYAGPKILFNFS